MRNGIAIILILLLASGVWLVRRSYPKAGDPLEETRAAAMDSNAQPAVPATPAPSDTKPPDLAASAPPPPPADVQPADLAPQTIPITDAVRETDTISNVVQVTQVTAAPDMMDTPAARQEQHVFYQLRLGYDHTQFGRGGDTWHAGAQFNVRPEAWYGGAPDLWDTLLIPDATIEIGHAGIATTTKGTPTTGDGVRTDLSLYFPWLKWAGAANGDDASSANAAPKTKFSLGPVLYGAFQEITSVDVAHPEWVRYGGVRFMFKHSAYVEYVVGKTDSLPKFRQQADFEFPIYQKEGSAARYVVRGVWNTDYSSDKDVFGISLLAEFPFDYLAHPARFRDLVPFVK